MLASDPSKKLKKGLNYLKKFVYQPKKDLSELLKEKHKFKDIRIDEFQPLIVDEIIPREDETPLRLPPPFILNIKFDDNLQSIKKPELQSQLSFQEPSEKILSKISSKIQNPSQSEPKKILFYFYQMDKPTIKFEPIYPAELERLIEFRKIDLAPQPSLYFQNLQSFSISQSSISPQFVVLNLERRDVLVDRDLNQDSQSSLKPAYESIKFYMDVFPNLNFAQNSNFSFFQKTPQYVFVKLAPKSLAAKTEAKPIEQLTTQKTIPSQQPTSQPSQDQVSKREFVLDISKYFEIGQSKEDDLTKMLEQSSKPQTAQVAVSEIQKPIVLDKKLISEYNNYFAMHANLSLILDEKNAQYYYEKMDKLGKDYYKAIKAQQLYLELSKLKSGPDYEKLKSKFLEFLDNCTPDQRILIEKVILITKSVQELVELSEKAELELVPHSLNTYNKLLQKDPSAKIFVEYQFAKYGFLKTHNLQGLDFDQTAINWINNLYNDLSLWVIAKRACFLDELINKTPQNSLNLLAARTYSKILLNKSNLEEKLSIIKSVNIALKNFFFNDKDFDANLVDFRYKELIWYEIASVIYALKNNLDGG